LAAIGGAPLKRIVVLTGAGISAESGLQTFRGADGLWEGHRGEPEQGGDGRG
jgi:NAD-dependent deacetylase